ncbi:hypothetical protein GCM10020295_21870 [Streptomyces cinereospinus]
MHVVARVARPGHEGEQHRQHAAADEARGPGQLAAPQGVLAGHGRGDRVGHVVVDGGRQRCGERAQREEFAVQDVLGGEGARAVEDPAVPAYEVVADRRARGGALPGEPEDLRVEVDDRDVVGQGHVDPAVGRDDRDPAEAEPAPGGGARSGSPRGGCRGGRDAHLLLPLSGGSGSAV